MVEFQLGVSAVGGVAPYFAYHESFWPSLDGSGCPGLFPPLLLMMLPR